MCSLIDFIDKQKYLIKTKRKTIESLYEFLDTINKQQPENQIQSNGDRKLLTSKPSSKQLNGNSTDNCVSFKRADNSNNLMFQSNGFLSTFDDKKEELKRKQLNEERRREYNQFLQQQKEEFVDLKRVPKRVINISDDYNDLLNSKRLEERRLREVSDVAGDIEDTQLTNGIPIPGISDGSGRAHPEVLTVDWFRCSNNKFVPEYITPRSRLLASHSSRLKAAKYREELRQQIEEKQRLKAEEDKRIRLEEEELERRLEAQRKQLLKEFEEEHRLKAQQKLIEEKNKQILNKEFLKDSSTPISLMRSPTYMRLKERQTVSPSPKKVRSVSRSLASAMSQTLRERDTQSMATQTSEEQKYYTSGESSDDESQISSDNEEVINDEKNKEVEFRRRVLSQLSDVRRMMESDHIKMMEQLRLQQLDQLDQ